MLPLTTTPKPIQKIQGFNLIEILLAITFFSLAFSGMLLGSTSMINTATNGTKINEDTAVTAGLFAGVNPNSAYIEASAAQLTTIGASTTSIANNPPGDISTRRELVIPDTTTSTTDNRRLFYDRWVYSGMETPDIKTVQVNLYPNATTTTPTKSIIRKIDKRNECFAMGVDRPLYMPSFGQPCTGLSSSTGVPYARAMNPFGTGTDNTQNYSTDLRINGASGQYALFNATGTAPPVEATDKGHQVTNSAVAEYWIEATPNIAYNLIVGLRKQTAAQTYTIEVNIYAGPDCSGTVRPHNCRHELITVNTSTLGDIPNGEPFNVKFENIMPDPGSFAWKWRGFHVTVKAEGSSAADKTAVIHFIKKELATNESFNQLAIF